MNMETSHQDAEHAVQCTETQDISKRILFI